MIQEMKPPRSLSLLQTSAVVIGSVIGSGVFINIPIVAKYAGSPGMSVIIWLVGGLLWIPQILILAEMGTAYPDQGGPYAYLVKAGSPLLGFLYTWTAFLTSDTPTLTIVGLTASSALVFFFPGFADPTTAKIFAAALICLLAWVQYRSVKTGGNVQIVLTIAKLLPLAALVVFGLFSLRSGNPILTLSKFDGGGSGFAAVTAGVTATLWAYAGFLNILYMAGEVRDPSRVLPRALIGSLAFVTFSYTMIALCTNAVVPFQDIVAAAGKFINPFTSLAFFADYAGGFFAIAAFVSMVGVLNSVIMTQPRLEYAIARDGLFFSAFGHLHPKHLTPDYSIFIQAALSICLFLLGDIENMLGYFTLSYVIQNALVYGAIYFLPRRADYHPAYRSPVRGVLAGISILIQMYIAYGTVIAYPLAGVLASFGLILSGLPVYFWFHRRNKTGALAGT